jgi:8-amino-7-oxononanoate synthase
MIATHLQNLLAQHRANHLLRVRHEIEERAETMVTINGKQLVNFCGNDYLNIATNPAVTHALVRGAEKYGLGSTASQQISGYVTPHRKLEEAMAEFLQRDRALLFNSGYHANLGVLTTFANRTTAVIADKYCHASLHDGALLARARYYRYKHSDLAHAEQWLIQKTSAMQHSLLVTESVFSMQGDIADISRLAQLAQQYHSLLVVDDAHGIGILGEGRGGCYALSQQAVPCLVTPFGKALGSMGAVVSGSHELIEALLQFARTHRYSTALPPAVCEATLAGLTILKNESWRREKLAHLIQFFIQAAKAKDLRLYSEDATPIKSIIIGTNEKTVYLQEKLAAAGFFVSCIRPPTVPKNFACLRISLSCAHSEEQILQLLDNL